MNYKATLVRGGVYVLGNRVFKKDEPLVVDEATKKHLEEHAVDSVTVDGVAELRQKFVFEPVVEDVRRDAAVERVRKPA